MVLKKYKPLPPLDTIDKEEVKPTKKVEKQDKTRDKEKELPKALKTYLPETEMNQATNRPVLNIDGMDDIDLAGSIDKFLPNRD